MRNHNLDAEGGKAAAANGARPVAKKRRKRRRWSAEEKVRIARESFASSEDPVPALSKRPVIRLGTASVGPDKAMLRTRAPRAAGESRNCPKSRGFARRGGLTVLSSVQADFAQIRQFVVC